MDSYYQLPYVTHEDNSDESNYIYVKNHSTMWDGVVNLSYKLTGMYPYISGTNCVRITADSDPSSFSYDDDQILATGMAYNFKRMISHFNMSDINGDYGNITLEDSFVTDKKIIRHNVFELDSRLWSTEASFPNVAICVCSAATAAITARICAILSASGIFHKSVSAESKLQAAAPALPLS